MFERYTERARRLLFFSRYEASQSGSVSIGPEHLLLGMIREPGGIVNRILTDMRVSRESIVKDLEPVRASIPIPTSVEIPFDSHTKRILQFAAEEADGLSHKHIGVEHLFLGILRESDCSAATILVNRGMALEKAREDVLRLFSAGVQDHDATDLRQPLLTRRVLFSNLQLKLEGYTKPGQELFRNVLFDQLVSSIPKDPQAKVQIYNAEIAPGGYTNWHCHNGATFFIALQGEFEAEFEEGILVKAKAGDVYSEPVGKFHRGHNPHPDLPYLCIAICITPPDKDHVTNVPQRPW